MAMTAEQYLKKVVKRTANTDVLTDGLTEEEWAALLRAGPVLIKTGKTAEYLKKVIFHRHKGKPGRLRDMLNGVAEAAWDGATARMPWRKSEQPSEKARDKAAYIGKDGVFMLNIAIGLVGESIEFFDLIYRQIILDREIPSADMLLTELGDIGWYQGAFLNLFNFSYSDMFERNDAKLAARYKKADGSIQFSTGNSEGRKEAGFEETTEEDRPRTFSIDEVNKAGSFIRTALVNHVEREQTRLGERRDWQALDGLDEYNELATRLLDSMLRHATIYGSIPGLEPGPVIEDKEWETVETATL